ncbi:MAG: hypothetical protein ABMB14_23180, partial [Myxococcota bacterium]
MSEDLLRTARQLLAELAADEAYLRALAFEALPYDKVMAVERRANRRSAALLARLGVAESAPAAFDGPDSTDELLSAARPAQPHSAPPR